MGPVGNDEISPAVLAICASMVCRSDTTALARAADDRKRAEVGEDRISAANTVGLKDR
jgi:hypothetical protein